MADGTSRDGRSVESALDYDAGERRTHEEHAAEAYDAARLAEIIGMSSDSHDPGVASRSQSIQARHMVRAQWHATMAVYELMVASRPWA